MLVVDRQSNHPAVEELRPASDLTSRVHRKWLRFSGNTVFQRSSYEILSSDRTGPQFNLIGPLEICDVINLHWVSGLFDELRFLPLAAEIAPLVWTMHDMRPFTGGCHYDNGCGRFADRCGSCPQLRGDRDNDWTRRVWNRRQLTFSRIPRDRLTFVAPSRWLAAEAGRSSLLKDRPVKLIPYGIDTDTFSPRPTSLSRDVFGIPPQAKVVLFVCGSLRAPRKGANLLIEALDHLQKVPELFVVVLGEGNFEAPAGIPVLQIKNLENDRLLSFLYSAADVYVIPSLQDNLPNTVLEAIACGTPCVGFDVGGIADMIRTEVTGILARPFDCAELANAIEAILSDRHLSNRLQTHCREVAETEFNLKLQASRYSDLYNHVISLRCSEPNSVL